MDEDHLGGQGACCYPHGRATAGFGVVAPQGIERASRVGGICTHAS